MWCCCCCCCCDFNYIVPGTTVGVPAIIGYVAPYTDHWYRTVSRISIAPVTFISTAYGYISAFRGEIQKAQYLCGICRLPIASLLFSTRCWKTPLHPESEMAINTLQNKNGCWAAGGGNQVQNCGSINSCNDLLATCLTPKGTIYPQRTGYQELTEKQRSHSVHSHNLLHCHPAIFSKWPAHT